MGRKAWQDWNSKFYSAALRTDTDLCATAYTSSALATSGDLLSWKDWGVNEISMEINISVAMISAHHRWSFKEANFKQLDMLFFYP
jgi:hypothetical protein